MEDESLNFGSDGAGATPGSNSILAQPPLEEESPTQEGSGEGDGATVEGNCSRIFTLRPLLTRFSI